MLASRARHRSKAGTVILPQSITERTQEAQRLKQDGRHGDALVILRDLAEVYSDNVVVLHNYAASLGDIGRHGEAVEVLKSAFAKGLNAPESWLVYARALAGARQFDAAKQAFLTLLRLKPFDAEAHRDLAQLIWMRTGDQMQALFNINQALEKNPNDWALHMARAKIYGQTGDPKTAYAVLSELAKRSGGAAILETAACNAALALDNFNAAVEHGRRAIDGAPDDAAAATAYASALLSDGRHSQASAIIEKLRERHPLNQLFIALQATVWKLMGDERYEIVMDYEKFVFTSVLETPQGWRSLDHYLSDLIEALDEMHCFEAHPFAQSVKNGSQISSITNADHPAMQAFEEAASGPVMRYLEQLGEGDDPLRKRNTHQFRLHSAWSIKLPATGFHVNHVHPDGWISSACHLRATPPEPGNADAGRIKFGEPGIETQPRIEPARILKPEPGVIVLFPSYMWHGTIPFQSQNTRLTVAADFAPTKSS